MGTLSCGSVRTVQQLAINMHQLTSSCKLVFVASMTAEQTIQVLKRIHWKPFERPTYVFGSSQWTELFHATQRRLKIGCNFGPANDAT